MFDKIVEELKKLRNEIEAMDDSTIAEDIRSTIGLAHYHIEKCIDAIDEI